MKAFRYSLQRLLDVKESIEKRHQRRVAQAIRDVGQEQRLLARLRADVQRAAVWRADGARVLNPRDLTLQSQYLGFLRAEVEKSVRRVEACQRVLTLRQAELHQAARERSSLERLRAHEHDAWNLECKRAEQRAMDESASHQNLHDRRMVIRERERAA